MRLRHGCLLVVAAVLAQSADRDVRSDDSEGRKPQITIITSPSALPVGTECQVELNPEKNDQNEVVETVYWGKIAKANDDEITLTVASVKRKASSQSIASRLPVVNRLFTNVGIVQPKPGEAKNVRISAEKIRSVKLARHSSL